MFSPETSFNCPRPWRQKRSGLFLHSFAKRIGEDAGSENKTSSIFV
jgi:hypothetical protein